MRSRFEFILSLGLVLGSAVLCGHVISNSIVNQKLKNADTELNHVKYGFLSVDEWKRQVAVILSDEIRMLYLTKRDQRQLHQHLEVLLDTLISKLDKKIRESNTGSAKGWIKQSIMDLFIDLDEIKEGVPDYADAIVQEMTKSKTRGRIETMLNKRLEQYSNQTFNTQDLSQMNRVLAWIGAADVESARIKVRAAILVRLDLIIKEAVLLILLSIVIFGLSGFGGKPLDASRIGLLLLQLVILLAAGVTTPMIDLGAKISKISLMLMGHPIHFENQVLYFQSKSILDVFRIMIVHEDLPMKFVGVLLITFSIVFPLLKMAASWVHYYDFHRARKNPVILFFALKSGKWSMTDVLVVAIFMAYIGFNGMLTSQFGQLNATTPDLMILTTSGTSLQPGYYLFLTYALLALFFSGILTRKTLKTTP